MTTLLSIELYRGLWCREETLVQRKEGDKAYMEDLLVMNSIADSSSHIEALWLWLMMETLTRTYHSFL